MINLGVTIQPIFKLPDKQQFRPTESSRSDHRCVKIAHPPSALHRDEEEAAWKGVLCEAVETLAKEAESLPLRVSYAEMTERFGEDVFGGKQPKRALEIVREELKREGVQMEIGVSLKRNNRSLRGVTIFGRISDRG